MEWITSAHFAILLQTTLMCGCLQTICCMSTPTLLDAGMFEWKKLHPNSKWNTSPTCWGNVHIYFPIAMNITHHNELSESYTISMISKIISENKKTIKKILNQDICFLISRIFTYFKNIVLYFCKICFLKLRKCSPNK